MKTKKKKEKGIYLIILGSKKGCNIKKAEKAIAVFIPDSFKISQKDMDLWGGEMIKRIIQSYGKTKKNVKS